MIAFAFLCGCLAAGPLSFLLGVFAGRDSRVTHEPADIGPALRRSK
jgi:hypothetical protein